MFRKLKFLLLGGPRNPFRKETRQSISLVALMAWVGLGADGLSSSCYGPEEAFKALVPHVHLALYMVPAIAFTIFIICLAYSQVITLFPSGGGGYKVAGRLIHPKAGVVSGSALVVDYVLTVTLSVSAGMGAIFSMLPLEWHHLKIWASAATILFLIWMNLRGVKESIRILLPIFLTFVITHVVLIVFGIVHHATDLPTLIPATIAETTSFADEVGWLMVVAVFLRAFSLGGGTYTGLEGVSTNVNHLAEPKVQTGKLTMIYIALSLSFVAAGMVLLYLLWGVMPVEGKTMNAATFEMLLQQWDSSGTEWSRFALPVVLASEAMLLFVAANASFLSGPTVLANMASDQWMPHQFSYLSSRLVAKFGIVLMGMASLTILLWSQGDVSLLIILYSINVFITFTMSMLGLCIHWLKERRKHRPWLLRFCIAAVGLFTTAGILIVTVVTKFSHGGWVTLVITGLLITMCISIKRHYSSVFKKLELVEKLFAIKEIKTVVTPPAMDPTKPTAVLIVDRHLGTGMHSLLWILKLFPNIFKNFIFLTVGEVDSQSFGEEEGLDELKKDVGEALQYYINFCHSKGIAAEAYRTYGTDVIDKLTGLTERVMRNFPNCVFFSSKLIFENPNPFTELLHNQTALIMQRRLHLKGKQMVILPMKI